jgi:N6-L-threonylcarbamoyladenine synthase
MKWSLESLRFFFRVDFPYLVFLLSGGHCLLTVAKDVDEFVVLGSTLDDSPGECLKKKQTDNIENDGLLWLIWPL